LTFSAAVSGKFEKGMKVKVARTGRLVSLSRPQQMFAQSRATVQEGFAGDVIGLTSAHMLLLSAAFVVMIRAVCLASCMISNVASICIPCLLPLLQSYHLHGRQDQLTLKCNDKVCMSVAPLLQTLAPLPLVTPSTQVRGNSSKGTPACKTCCSISEQWQHTLLACIVTAPRASVVCELGLAAYEKHIITPLSGA
jgi:hypothetical protein